MIRHVSIEKAFEQCIRVFSIDGCDHILCQGLTLSMQIFRVFFCAIFINRSCIFHTLLFVFISQSLFHDWAKRRIKIVRIHYYNFQRCWMIKRVAYSFCACFKNRDNYKNFLHFGWKLKKQTLYVSSLWWICLIIN